MTVPVGQSSYSLSRNWYGPLLFLNPALAQDFFSKASIAGSLRRLSAVRFLGISL